jgi:dihydroxycyclohexadiene carboxylate dehydrogenase
VQPFWHYTEEQVKEEIDQSFWSTLWCCRAVLPIMREQRNGAIVNVGSLAPRGIYRVPYAAAKGGVFALTTSLALEVASTGIRVNCVAPGPVDNADRVTPRNPHRTRAYRRRHPLARRARRGAAARDADGAALDRR